MDSNNGEIVVTEIQETEYGEEAVIDSPYEARSFIRVLPWQTYEEELDEYGSLRQKARERDDDIAEAAFEAVDAYGGFPADFSAHAGWDSEKRKWTIDVDAIEQASEFWEYVGFDVSVSPNVNLPNQ